MLEPGKKDCILVMEDEEEINEIVTAYLEKEGYEILSADDGLRGMRLFYESGRTW